MSSARARRVAFERFNDALRLFIDDREARRQIARALARLHDTLPSDVGDWSPEHFLAARRDLEAYGIELIRHCWLYIHQHPEPFADHLWLRRVAAVAAGEDLLLESRSEADRTARLCWRFGVPVSLEERAAWHYVVSEVSDA